MGYVATLPTYEPHRLQRLSRIFRFPTRVGHETASVMFPFCLDIVDGDPISVPLAAHDNGTATITAVPAQSHPKRCTFMCSRPLAPCVPGVSSSPPPPRKRLWVSLQCAFCLKGNFHNA